MLKIGHGFSRFLGKPLCYWDLILELLGTCPETVTKDSPSNSRIAFPAVGCQGIRIEHPEKIADPLPGTGCRRLNWRDKSPQAVNDRGSGLGGADPLSGVLYYSSTILKIVLRSLKLFRKVSACIRYFNLGDKPRMIPESIRSDIEKRFLTHDPARWFFGSCLEFKRPVTTLERIETAVSLFDHLPHEDQLLCLSMGRLCREILALPEPEPWEVPEPVMEQEPQEPEPDPDYAEIPIKLFREMIKYRVQQSIGRFKPYQKLSNTIS